jgi:hypothetical protein
LKARGGKTATYKFHYYLAQAVNPRLNSYDPSDLQIGNSYDAQSVKALYLSGLNISNKVRENSTMHLVNYLLSINNYLISI